jgi:chromosome segregation ATPase
LKSEVKSLYEQLKAAKEENLDLLKEIEYLKDSLSTDSIYEFFPGSKELSQKISACQTLRKNAENNAEFFKDELEKKVEEVKELRKEVEKMKEENQNTFRKDELKKIVILKDEQMKSLNKRFQVMVSKLDSLLKEKENWENEKKTLENEKKKLSERWQQ